LQTGNDDLRELVRSRTDLVALIGESVGLQAKGGGREYVGLCPFHEDKNPSLTVSPERQRYKCWSCGAGGDCFSFVMEREGLGFREALEMLAEKARVELPKRSVPRGPSDGPSRKDVFELLAWAERTLHRALKSPEGERGRRYLAERGVSDAMIERFQVGFHPGGWQWLMDQARNLFDGKRMLAAKLMVAKKEGRGFYDHHSIRGRVVFPIRDERGRCVAFGGRLLPSDEGPKYINGDDAPHFSKSQTLYGLDVAKDAVRLGGTAVVTEGYTDCIACHQNGIENAVAVLGTALTEQHVVLLKRFARKVVLVLDGDAAGLGAAERSLAQFLAKEVDLRVLALPTGKDPADFLIEEGAERFAELIEHAPEAWDFKLKSCLDRVREQGDSLDARHAAMDEMLDLLSKAEGLKGTTREDFALSKLSQRLMIDERVVRQRLDEGRKLTKQRNQTPAGVTDTKTPVRVDFFNGEPSRFDRMECEVLEIVFAEPKWFPSIQADVGPEDFRNEYTRALFETCRDLAEQGHEPSYEKVTSSLEDVELKRLAALLDDWSHEKQVATKLRLDGITPGNLDSESRDSTSNTEHRRTENHDETSTDARVRRPRFLDLAVDNLKWRRQERTHELSKGRMASRSDQPTALDDDVRALLEGATRFHGQRARKKT
jgi:DNA primase